MAIIRVPPKRPELSGTQIPLGHAERAGRSAAELGRIQQQEGAALVREAAKSLEAFKATNSQAEYTNAKANASLEFAKALQARLQNPMDENGNPTFSTLPDDIANIGQSIMGKYANTISDPRARAQFTSGFANKISSQQLRSISIAHKQQLDFANAASFNESIALREEAASDPGIHVNTFLQEKRAGLDARVHRGELSATAAAKEYEQFRRDISTSRLNGMITGAQDIESLNQLSDQIRGNPDEFGINHREQQAALQDIRNRQRQLAAGINAQRKAQEATLKPQIEAYYDSVEKGLNFDPNARLVLEQSVKGTKFERDFVYTQLVEDELLEFAQQSGAERSRVLSALKREPQNEATLFAIQKFEEADKRIAEAIKDDPEGFATQQSLIAPTEPLNLDNPEELVTQFAQRRANIDVVESSYNVNSDGLSNADLDELSRKLETSNPEEQSNIYAAILSGYGEKAINVFSSLRDKGFNSAAAIGLMHIQGNVLGARNVILGNEAIKNESVPMPKKGAILAETPEEAIALGLSDAQIKAKQDAVMSIYAAKSLRDRDFSGEVDDDRLEEAWNEVNMGGLIDIDDESEYVIEPPIASIDTEDKWLDMLRGVNRTEIEQMGGLRGIDPREVTRAFQEGRFVTRGPGRYNILDRNDVPYQAEDGQIFEFNYFELMDIRNGTHKQPEDLHSALSDEKHMTDKILSSVEVGQAMLSERLEAREQPQDPISPRASISPRGLGKVSLQQRHGILKHGSRRPVNSVHEVVLHHTGGSSVEGAVSTLRQRGLSYHYIIDKDGTITELVNPEAKAFHAKHHNNGTIGISYVGGGPGGAISQEAVEASAGLINELKGQFPALKNIAGHKHRANHGKHDPENVDIGALASLVGLRFAP
jgi:hypothetical protein